MSLIVYLAVKYFTSKKLEKDICLLVGHWSWGWSDPPPPLYSLGMVLLYKMGIDRGAIVVEVVQLRSHGIPQNSHGKS